MKINNDKITSYQDIDWRRCQDELLQKQQHLVEAYRAKQNRIVKNLQRQIVTSFAARALAVRRVTNNKGGQTPGVDGAKWPDPNSRLRAVEQLRNLTQNPNSYRALPVRRVEIPKPGNRAEKRPLGIPTLTDRAMQAVYLSSIEPLVEETSDANSYGFRPYRGAREAVAKLRNLLGKDYSPEWVLDADIQKCFDKINHDWLVQNVPIGDKAVLESWLKSGVAYNTNVTATVAGVPQGGVISPALANITLNGLEAAVKTATAGLVPKRERSKVYLIRYADDFVATAGSENLLSMVEQSASEFLSPRGLQLHPQKTRSLALSQNKFEFLGFEFSKHALDPQANMPSAKKQTKSRLIIKPSRANIAELRNNVRQVIKTEIPMPGLISRLNPKLRGWANYFRVARHSQKSFKSLGNWVWFKMLRWAQRKHTNRNIAWIRERYVAKSSWRTNHWCTKTQRGVMFLLDLSTVPTNSYQICAKG